MSQPMEEYPNPEMTRQPESSSHSNGSFGPVFVVLAVIVVISAVACVLGRMSGKRSHRVKEAAQHSSKGSKPSKGLGPKEWETRQKPSFMKDGDIEFGFDKRMPPSGKGGPPKNGSGGGGGGGGGGKANKPQPHHQNGGHKPDIRFSNNV